MIENEQLERDRKQHSKAFDTFKTRTAEQEQKNDGSYTSYYIIDNHFNSYRNNRSLPLIIIESVKKFCLFLFIVYNPF